jgi:hypothetical protein
MRVSLECKKQTDIDISCRLNLQKKLCFQNEQQQANNFSIDEEIENYKNRTNKFLSNLNLNGIENS